MLFILGAKFGQNAWDVAGRCVEKETAGARQFSDAARAELLRYNQQQKTGLPFDYPGDDKSRRLDSLTIERCLMDNLRPECRNNSDVYG